MYLIQNLYQIH